MRQHQLFTGIISTALLVLAAGFAAAAPATRVVDAIWADDELFGTVVTDTTFMSPPLHSTDVIYSFMMSGLSGQHSVAEAAPGNPEFNGGRWNVHVVMYTADGLAEFDGDGDGTVNYELTNAQEVVEAAAMGYLQISPANFYFECPLLPSRGR